MEPRDKPANSCLIYTKKQQINICCSKKFRFSKTIMQNKEGGLARIKNSNYKFIKNITAYVTKILPKIIILILIIIVLYI